MKKPSLSYKKAGVNIAKADRAKKDMKASLHTKDKRVLNSLGAFASLFEASFPGFREPVLVMKTEEPGSKQLLSFAAGKVDAICRDMIHHLINDIIVMGATPLMVQDAVICGSLEPKIVNTIVASIARACRENDCTLTGGETSEQPGTLAKGTYVLTASIVGVVEKSKIIDGSAIKKGDIVLAIPSNGLHTNGYTLVRALLKKNPRLAKKKIGGKTFLEHVLLPHACYYQALKGLFGSAELHGLAHITGGGIAGNLNRVLPPDLNAEIMLDDLKILPIFKTIREEGNISDRDMLQTFNMGVGITVVCDPKSVSMIQEHLHKHGCKSYEIGVITSGNQEVKVRGKLRWS